MPIFFISLIGAYLIGNVYIFWRGAQAATAFPMGLKVVLALLYVCGALLFFVSFFGRDIRMPLELSHLFHQIGTGWLVFTLYMVAALLLFDLLALGFAWRSGGVLHNLVKAWLARRLFLRIH